MATITLEYFHDHPIHCPFCGKPVSVHEHDPEGDCEHWLYTAYNEFLHVSKRFIDEGNNVPEALAHEADLNLEEQKKYGTTFDILDRSKANFYNLVEFDLSNNYDGYLIGFSPLKKD